MKKYFIYWIILYLPFAIVCTYIAYVLIEKESDKKSNLNYWIGRQFPPNRLFLNSQGEKTKLEYSTEYTILDFWFMRCSPCIEEMKLFEEVLKKNKGNIFIYSISIDNFLTWQKLFNENIKLNGLLMNAVKSNSWKQLSIATKTDSLLNYGMVAKREFKIQQYPSYLVLDRNGTVISTPKNLNEFISTKINNQSKYIFFIKNILKSEDKVKIIRAYSIAYTIFFMLTIAFSLLLIKILTFFKH